MMQNLKMKYCISVYICVSVIINEVWTAEISRKNRTENAGRGHVFNVDCPDFGDVEHGVVTRIDANIPALRIECDDGYDLIGRPKILCQNGLWENIPRPQCAKRCNPPPFIRYGEVRIDSRTEESTFFRKGSLVTYSCAVGFSLIPPNSRVRECKDGIWTGIQGTCVSDGCPWPANITNGYFVLESPPPPGSLLSSGGGPGDAGRATARVGQRAHYNCNLGFALSGEPTQQCVDSGEWSPRRQPACRPAATPPSLAPPPAVADDGPPPAAPQPMPQQPLPEPPEPQQVLRPAIQDEEIIVGDDPNAGGLGSLLEGEGPRPCPGPPPRPEHAALVALSAGPADAASAAMAAGMGAGAGAGAPAGTRLQLRCRAGYRDPQAPCADFPLVCEDGEWRGRLPECEPADGCPPPPASPHAAPLGLSTDGRYASRAQVAYACLPGYALQGPALLTCAPSGCWEPQPAQPVCKLDPRLFVPAVSPRTLADYLSTSSILLVSAATVLGVMLLLLGVCALVVCRRGKLTAAAAAAAAAAQRAAAAAAAARLLDPDRVALIAYADGQLSESALPTYEEAVRERLGGGGGGGGGGLSLLAQYRALHGRPPPWAPLGAGRRNPRNGNAQQQQQQQDLYVSRQASWCCSASHGGAGGGGDSTGSTDTMTPSEVSTTVTLDTASSHTCSSHSASCRAACGSLASFDAASALTSEGVPLLEEQEPDDLLPPPPPPPASAAPSDLMVGGGPPYCKLRRSSPDIV